LPTRAFEAPIGPVLQDTGVSRAQLRDDLCRALHNNPILVPGVASDIGLDLNNLLSVLAGERQNSSRAFALGNFSQARQ
jgi:hypothetical protein